MSHSIVISTILIMLGLYLLVAYSMVADSIKTLPAASSAQRANQGIFTMGITFIVSGFAFAMCNWNCNCADLNASGNVYIGFFLVLGIVLTSLAGVLVSNVSGKGKGWAVTTLVFGVLLMVSCIGFMMYKHKDKISSGLGSLYPTKPLAFAFY